MEETGWPEERQTQNSTKPSPDLALKHFDPQGRGGFQTCWKSLSDTDLSSGLSFMTSCSILLMLLLNSFSSISFMSSSSNVSVLEPLDERTSSISLEH